jgi:thiol-disulfide isomerase/thioredoxin
MLRTAAFVLCVAAAAVAGADPLHYRFELGQELQYKGTKKDWFRDKLSESEIGWRLWVTQVKPDGSCDIVIEPDTADDGKCLAQITVNSDGRIPWNATMNALPAWLSVRRLLPMLPTKQELLKSKWTHTEPGTQVRWDYAGGPNADSLAISATCRGPIEFVSVGSQQFTWTFDITKGLITHFGDKGTWENYKERDEESVTLADIIQHDTGWTDSFRAETERYFQKAQEYKFRFAPSDSAVQVRAASATGADAMLKQAREFLEAGKGDIKHAIVGDQFRRLLKEHDESAKWMKSRLEAYQKIVDKDSTEWTTADLEGKTHSLADYAGKVVVLDFWFRACNYCIRAQPQVDAVVEHFRGKSVQFLGMNVDKDVDDAKFAVAQLHPKYPTLLGEKVHEKYGLRGCPIWLILDQGGVVRSIHDGYSGNLQDELTESITKLLK